METIKINVQWCDTNFGASMDEKVPGAVVFTAATFEQLQKEAADTLRFHVEGMIEDGDEVPQWLVDGDYEFEYVFLDAVSLLRAYTPYLSLTAISRASGINQHQLSHYVNGVKTPRSQQRKRIVDGLHSIGHNLLAVR